MIGAVVVKGSTLTVTPGVEVKGWETVTDAVEVKVSVAAGVAWGFFRVSVGVMMNVTSAAVR